MTKFYKKIYQLGHSVDMSLSELRELVMDREAWWRRKWQPTPVFLPGESQGWVSLVGCRLWDSTE